MPELCNHGYAFIFESVYDNAIRISPRPLLNPGMEQVVYYQECNMLRRKEAATTDTNLYTTGTHLCFVPHTAVLFSLTVAITRYSLAWFFSMAFDFKL